MPQRTVLCAFHTASLTCLVSVSLLARADHAASDGSEAAPEGEIGREVFCVSTAALMWPGATRSFLIGGDGSLDNGEWLTHLGVFADGAPADSPRVVAYEPDALPVAHWRRRNGDVEWTCEAVALPSPQDSGLIASVEIKATNHGQRVHEAALVVSFESPRKPVQFVAADAPESSSTAYVWAGERSTRLARGWFDGRGSEGRASVSWKLAPGQTRRARVVVPGYPSEPQVLRQWVRVPHSRRVTEAKKYWAKMLDSGVRLSLGDPEVETAFRGALVILLGCTERHSGRLIPLGNPFQYRDVWLRDGARSVAALAMAGQVQTARDLVSGFLAYQCVDGHVKPRDSGPRISA